MSADANRQAVQASYDGFLTGDLSPLVAIMADDIEWTSYEDNPFNGTHRGPEAVLAFFASFDSIEMTKFEPESMMAEGDRVVVILNVGYTVQATGKTWDGPVAHIFDFEAGKLARFREFSGTSASAWS